MGGLIAAGGLIIAGTGADNSGAFAIGGIIVGAIITFGAYLFFRHGSEIIEGDFTDKRYGLGGLGDIAKQIGDVTGGRF